MRRGGADTRAGLSLALLAALSRLAGCGSEPPGPGVPARIEVEPEFAEEVVGNEVAFSARAFDDSGGELAGVEFEWAWEAEDGALLVDEGGGRFRLEAPGEARVWAEAAGLADTAELRVAAEGEVRWAVRLDWFWTLGGPALSPEAETLYVLTQVSDESSRLWAVRAADGGVKWSLPIDGAAATYPFVGADGTIYVMGEVVWAVWPDGTVRWTLPIPTSITSILRGGAISDDGVLYAAVEREFLALDVATRDTLWAGPFVSFGSWVVPPTLDAGAGVVYASWGEGPLHAFDAATGELLWARPDTYMVENPGFDARHWAHGPVPADGRVYWPIRFHLEALTPENEVLWVSDQRGCCSAEPVVGADGTLLWQNGSGFEPRNPATGEALWRDPFHDSGIAWSGGPALAADATIYVHTPCGSCIDRSDGAGLFALDASLPETVRWGYLTNAERPPGSPSDWTPGMMGAPVIGPDGTVYTYNADTLFAFWENAPPAQTPWPMWRGDARRSGVTGGQVGKAPSRGSL